MSLSTLHRHNLKNIVFFQRNKSFLESADKIKKNIDFFLSTFRKITVGGIVNQLIKSSGLSMPLKVERLTERTFIAILQVPSGTSSVPEKILSQEYMDSSNGNKHISGCSLALSTTGSGGFMVLWFLLGFYGFYIFFMPSTRMLNQRFSQRRDHSLKSHPTDWCSQGSNSEKYAFLPFKSPLFRKKISSLPFHGSAQIN